MCFKIRYIFWFLYSNESSVCMKVWDPTDIYSEYLKVATYNLKHIIFVRVDVSVFQIISFSAPLPELGTRFLSARASFLRIG